MNIQFIIKGLNKSLFDSFINLSETELKLNQGQWLIVDNKPGYPCRVSLEDAEVGERVLALPFVHHDVSSPYRASGPIFVRETAVEKTLEVNQVPQVLRERLLSVRGYNGDNMMIEADIVKGTELERLIQAQFSNRDVDYIHVHNANPGCYSCCVLRA